MKLILLILAGLLLVGVAVGAYVMRGAFATGVQRGVLNRIGQNVHACLG